MYLNSEDWKRVNCRIRLWLLPCICFKVWWPLPNDGTISIVHIMGTSNDKQIQACSSTGKTSFPNKRWLIISYSCTTFVYHQQNIDLQYCIKDWAYSRWKYHTSKFGTFSHVQSHMHAVHANCDIGMGPIWLVPQVKTWLMRIHNIVDRLNSVYWLLKINIIMYVVNLSLPINRILTNKN